MKSALIGLIASLLLNLGIVTAFALRPAAAPPALRSWFESRDAKEAHVAAEAKETARRHAADAAREAAQKAKLWSELNSDDLKALAQRLRAAGFPPNVVRAVVVDALAQRMRPRYEALTASVSMEYWKQRGMGGMMDPKLIAERTQLNRERTRLLKEALGTEANDNFASSWMRMQYGNLPKDKADLVQRVIEDYNEMSTDVRNGMQGIILPEDRAKLALLDREKHTDLAAILSPGELEDFEMRTSSITGRLRSALALMDATEGEFRSIYALHKEYDSILNPGQGMGMVTYTDQMMQQRREAQDAIDAKLKQVLGEQRATEFQRDSSYDFQTLVRLTKAQSLPIDTAVRAYDLRADTAAQSVKIGDDPAMSGEQKVAALKQLAQQAKAQLLSTLGPDAGTSYLGTANWLQAIERGSIVSFHGSNTTFRSVRSVATPRR